MAHRSKRAEVEWDDITGYPGWHENADARKFTTAPCKSVGYVIHKTRRHLYLAQSLQADTDCGEVLIIPHGVIKRVKWIK